MHLLDKLLLSRCRSDEGEICKFGLVFSRLEGKRKDVKETERFPVLLVDNHQYEMSLHGSILSF